MQISRLRLRSAVGAVLPTIMWNTAGTTSPTALSTSRVEPSPAAVRLKRWVSYFKPPTSALSPNTSSTLPMMEPVIDAFTRSKYPARSAMMAMMSSAALPKVAFSRPPSPWPTCSAISSVACPIIPASGMMPRHATTKISVGGEWSTHSISMAIGTNTSSRFMMLPAENSGRFAEVVVAKAMARSRG
jgi:hypothetical protein